MCSGQSASPSLLLEAGIESTLESDPLHASVAECTLILAFGDNFFPNIRAMCGCEGVRVGQCACVEEGGEHPSVIHVYSA